MKIIVTAVTLFILGTFATAYAQTADVIYTNGKIFIVDGDQSVVQAVAIKDRKFIAVGSSEDVTGYCHVN